MKDENVNIAPAITPERLAENEEFQRGLRSKFASRFSLKSSLEIEMSRAALLLKANAEIINALHIQHAKAKTGKQTIKRMLNRYYSENAEAWASLGAFDKAADIEPDKRRKKDYLSKHKALLIDDSEWCSHLKYKIEDNHRLPNYFRESSVFSEKHGRVVAVLRCNECGFRNIAPLPSDLEKLSQDRAEAVKLTKGMRSEDAANLLAAKGFTNNRFKK